MKIGSFIGKLLGADKVVGKVVDAGTDITKTLSKTEQASRRQQSDMLGDNKLSKSIRPLIVIWAILLYSAMNILKYYGIDTDPEFKSTIHMILGLSVGFYFPAKTIEKFFKSKLRDQKKDPGKTQDKS